MPAFGAAPAKTKGPESLQARCIADVCLVVGADGIEPPTYAL
jgi:hypothetical protein